MTYKVLLKKILGLLWIVVFYSLLSACSLELEPRDLQRLDITLNSPENIDASIISVYANFRSVNHYGRDMFATADALADVSLVTANSGRFVSENRNFPGAHFAVGFWENGYISIEELNRILFQVAQGVEGASEVQLRTWEGEAKFLRALLIFDLAKVYTYIPTAIYQEGLVDQGGIPMPLQPKFSLDEIFFNQEPRASIEQNYIQIKQDLLEAIDLLEDAGRSAPQFASQSAAYALLSRVALYSGDWELALNASTSALNTTTAQLLGGEAYVNAWSAQVHPESIFEIRFHNESESLGSISSIQSAFTTILDKREKNRLGGWGDLVPSPKILAFFGLRIVQLGNPAANNNNWGVLRNEDIRAKLYTTGSNARPAGRQIECTKFFSRSGFNYGDNIPVLRTSEMVLNRIEANFRLGNFGEALSELNDFKLSRDLPIVDLSGEELLSEILNERLKEFAFEGQRFFDLKRNGMPIDKRSFQGEDALIPFEDFRILAPIPQTAVQRNRNLNQNRGY
ncbi:MAG: RagB/SusD family nutrient uptake outer membrane protein [Cecembia sp.]